MDETTTGEAQVVRHRTLWLERRVKDLRDVVPRTNGDSGLALTVGAAIATLDALAAESRDQDAEDARFRQERADDRAAEAIADTERQTWGVTEAGDLGRHLAQAHLENDRLRAELDTERGRAAALDPEPDRATAVKLGEWLRFRTALAELAGLTYAPAAEIPEDILVGTVRDQHAALKDTALRRDYLDRLQDSVLVAARAVVTQVGNARRAGGPAPTHDWAGVATVVDRLGAALDAAGVADPEPEPIAESEDAEATAQDPGALRSAFTPRVPSPAEVYGRGVMGDRQDGE